jgi:two-component sensor histidine kinase
MFARNIKSLHYKKLFLYGAYITIMILVVPASVIDYLIGSHVDVGIDLAFGALTYGAYRMSFRHQDTEQAAVWLFWIATLFEYIYLTVHSIDFDLIFSILIPLIAFISFPRNKVSFHLGLYYGMLLGYLVYGYVAYPHHPYLHDHRFMLALGVSHGFIIAYGLFYMLAVDESIGRLEASNRTQSLLLSEVHHRVKNNLNLVASILGLQGQHGLSSEVSDVLEENRKRIESMAILHEILYKKDQIGQIDLRLYLETLIDHIRSGEALGDIKITRTIEPIRLPMDQMILFGIMINEMITNSIKHAANIQGNITINLYFGRQENGAYLLRFCDDAVAVDKTKLIRGFGYSLIQMAAEHLKGDLAINSDHGLCYTVTMRQHWGIEA